MMHKQNGMTLIEVLLSLTILSIAGLLIWNVFIDGTAYSEKAVSQNDIQQEGTIISMALTKIHQTSERYEIKNENCGISVKDIIKDASTPSYDRSFDHPKLCITSDNTGIFEPEVKDYNIDLNIRIQDKDDPGRKLEVPITLYRLKEE